MAKTLTQEEIEAIIEAAHRDLIKAVNDVVDRFDELQGETRLANDALATATEKLDNVHGLIRDLPRGLDDLHTRLASLERGMASGGPALKNAVDVGAARIVRHLVHSAAEAAQAAARLRAEELRGGRPGRGAPPANIHLRVR